MPDDMLKDAIETSRRIINGVDDFDSQGLIYRHNFMLFRKRRYE